MDLSPLAPKEYPDLASIPGLSLHTAKAGIKYKDRTDLLLITFENEASVAGVFTKSKCPSAPVDWCKQILANRSARAVMVNAGNANAFTGVKGWETVRQSAEMVAKALNCAPNQVYLASTGVIGEPLAADKFAAPLSDFVLKQDGSKSWLDAARAIMTTDTFPKVAKQSFQIDHEIYELNGIAKGSGMIAPDMATMLAFLATDAPISSHALQAELDRHIKTTFNSITVDSDTSTSDTVLLFAEQPKENALNKPILDQKDKRLKSFSNALKRILLDLAHQVVRDGEGASKFMEIEVIGAKSSVSAKKVALTIGNSPLVKTAIAGEDANWGRIVMAVGKAGEAADRDRLAIWFGDIRVAVDGERDPSYQEEEVAKVMQEQEIKITVDLGLGRSRATIWTCDLTKQYVAINGDYRS